MVTDLNTLIQDGEDDDELVTSLRKQLRALKKDRDGLQEQVNTVNAAKREGDLDTWLKTAKIDPTVKSYVPETVVDAASLAAWLGNEGKIFSRLTLAEDPASPATPTPEQNTPQFEDSELARLLGQVSATEASAQPSNPADMQALLDKVKDIGTSATSEQDLAERLASIQMPAGFTIGG